MVFKNVCVLVLWMKVPSSVLEGLNNMYRHDWVNINHSVVKHTKTFESGFLHR